MEPSLAAWRCLRGEPIFAAPDAGLINHTWLSGAPPKFVVQRVNPLFAPSVHEDIEAVTAHLSAHGMVTPRLVRTDAGGLCSVAGDGAAWRVFDFLPGRTHHRVSSPKLAYEAATLVGRFHTTMDSLQWDYRHVRSGAHDTVLHMHRLDSAVHGGEPRAIADGILELWRTWEGSLDLPLRHCHGDLKISNLRFTEDGKAICLLDLDTLSRLSLDVELGDAWRSWCNPVGEDGVETFVDLEVLAAAITGYRAVVALPAELRAGLAGALERIALELAARFCRDAVEDNYFGWNAERFPTRVAHNLFRAAGQLNLARSARTLRGPITALLA